MPLRKRAMIDSLYVDSKDSGGGGAPRSIICQVNATTVQTGNLAMLFITPTWLLLNPRAFPME